MTVPSGYEPLQSYLASLADPTEDHCFSRSKLPHPSYPLFDNRPGAHSYQCGWCGGLVGDRVKHTQYHHEQMGQA